MVAENLKSIKEGLAPGVALVAVSKTKPQEAIQEAYDAGQRIFGENRIQEMAEKYEALPKDIQWHMIGHVQDNKIKYMAPFVSLIHGIESFKVLKEVNKQATKHERTINCLLQIKIAKEDSKFGMTGQEAKTILTSEEFQELKHVNISGVMGMATFTDNHEQIKSEFNTLKRIFDDLKISQPNLEIISMGMSGDYELAISCGSNMVRIGSSIFGERNYSN